METHLKLVRRLADGHYHSGEVLAATLGLSRAAVWKAARKASATLGLAIEARRGQGYRLPQPLELLDPARILATMSPSCRGRIHHLEIFDDIDSTNAYLLGQAGAPSGTLCLAERQSAGRGRRGRTWVSPYGANLYLSLLWRFAAGPGELGGLSLALGAVLAQLLETAGVNGIGLKWPNDLLWRRRKLAGLLLEVVAEAQGPSLVVAGLGLNTRLRGAQAQAIDQPWVDLDEILGAGVYSRNQVAALVAAAMTAAMERYGHEGLAPFLPLWRRYDRYHGELVDIHLGEQVISGLYSGLSDQGDLLVEVGGEQRAFRAGEVSLRPVGEKVAGARSL